MTALLNRQKFLIDYHGAKEENIWIKHEELFVSRFIRCKYSLNEHSSVNIYRLYLPSNAQVVF